MICKGLRPRNKKQRSKNHKVGVAIYDPNDTNDMKNMIAMDQAGQFSITLASGNKYIFIMLDYDSNYIKATHMYSRNYEEMVRCFKLCYDEFKQAGFTAHLLKLDNEVLKELIQVIEYRDLTINWDTLNLTIRLFTVISSWKIVS